MSDLRKTLQEVLAGTGTPAVLHNCRFEGAGASACGREAILELFRTEAVALDDIHFARSLRFGALFATTARGPVALFADLYNDQIGRLWYLGPHPLPLRRTDRIDVPHDPRLADAAPAVAFEAVDHPELKQSHAARITAFAIALLETRTIAASVTLSPPLRELATPRLFVLRAFSDGASTVLLLNAAALRSDDRPGLIQFHLAARLPSAVAAEAAVVIDEGQYAVELSRAWRPVL
jgi:hypothetical protein